MDEIKHSYPDRIAKRKKWLSIIQRWKESGLLIKKFCEQEQIKEADLKYWSYRLYSTTSIKVLRNSTNKKEIMPKFIPIALTPSTKHSNSSEDEQIELIIEKSYCLRLRKDFDEQMLLRLIQIIRRLNNVNAST